MQKRNNNDFRVLFVYPNTMMATLLPINISLLHACLREKGFDTRLFDTTFYQTEKINFELKKVDLLQIKKFSYRDTGIRFKETDLFSDINDLIGQYRPNLIAFTLVQDTFTLAQQIIEKIRHWHIPIIAGGVFTTFCPEDVIAVDGIRYICFGEGEGALVELCEGMRENKDITKIRNLWIKTETGIIKNELRPPVDLNTLPFIDYDIFEKERIYRPMQGKIYAMLHVELDRGCPYNCTYCGAPSLKKTYKEQTGCGYYRQKDIDRIIDEMIYLRKKFNPGYIDFNSETFLARSLDDLQKFALRYKKEINLPFWCQSRPETVTEEKVSLLKDMGCSNLQFGIEHGNEEFRRKMLNRNYSNRLLINALHLVEKYNIEYTVNNIMGFPEETRELIFDTIAVNRQITPTTMNVYLFTPYKGTYLYEYCVEKGYMDRDAPVNQLLDSTEMRNQPLSYTELKGLQRTFPLYSRFPESEWERIRRAETFDADGDMIYEDLKREYYAEVFHMNYDE